ncbi:hypothetical protein SFRURICE_020155 [Spodoptera frugiperda]|nr:hypothetical protein SFRURICE_020155 [Spodoptera frugiperda]
MTKAEVHITAHNGTVQYTPTLHHLCYRSHVIGSESIAIYHNARLCGTTKKFSKNQKKLTNTVSNPRFEPETHNPALAKLNHCSPN